LRTGCEESEIPSCLDEIRSSKWYRGAEDAGLSDLQFYAFFDDLLLHILQRKTIGREVVIRLFDGIQKKNWNSKKPVSKPLLTFETYEGAILSGQNEKEILERYNTNKPNSLRAFKAHFTRRQGKQKEKQNIGIRVIEMLREGKTKAEVIENLGLREFQFRGYLAAFKRGAYKHLLDQQDLRRTYVDSRGVVHTGSPNISDIENGYK